MNKKESEYSQIIKSTSIFGGVQFFKILIALVQSKFIAIVLGPQGMGVINLLQTSVGFIDSLTNLSLSRVAVKDVSSSVSTNNHYKINTTITVLKYLLFITGLLGTIIMFLFSSFLSEMTFQNHEYNYLFRWLSISLFFKQISSGYVVILQGFRKLKLLALASVYSSLSSLIVCIPIYYFFGQKGIVPVIILTTFLSFIINWKYSKHIPQKNISINFKTFTKETNNLFKMGIVASLSSVITVASSYYIRIYINNYGSISDVGLFSAGFTIISSYVGLIFTAMTTDYYPRLSSVSNNYNKIKETINQQAEITILIISPILIFFILFIKYIIIIIYSNKFILINDMMIWAAMGVFFKALGWCVGVVFMATGSVKIFFWSEFITNTIFLVLNLILYTFLGLEGLGISFLIGNFLFFLIVYYFSKINFNFNFSNNLIKLFCMQLVLGIISFYISYYKTSFFAYAIGLFVLIVSFIFSYKEINNRSNLKKIALSYFARK